MLRFNSSLGGVLSTLTSKTAVLPLSAASTLAKSTGFENAILYLVFNLRSCSALDSLPIHAASALATSTCFGNTISFSVCILRDCSLIEDLPACVASVSAHL